MTDVKTRIADWLSAGLSRVAPAQVPALVLERSKQAEHGDYATSVALQLARTLKQNPRELASKLVAALERWGTKSFGETVAPAMECAEHGFPVSVFSAYQLGRAADKIRR